MAKARMGPGDKLFVVALVVQLAVAAMLGASIVRAVDRPGRLVPLNAAPSSGPSAGATASSSARAGTGTTTTTTTTTGGGGGGGATTGITSGEIRVGGVFTLSGPADATPALHAAQAYFNIVNESGGVYGRKIRYITRDDHFDPSIGFAAVKDLVENQKVFAGVSWIAPNTENQQSIDYLQRNGIPLVGGFGQPAEFKSPIAYAFTTAYETGSRMFIRTMATRLGRTKIALVWTHLSDEIDTTILNSATDEARRDGAQIVYHENADVSKATYDDTVVRARAAGATGITTFMDAYSLSRYWQSFARSDWRPTQLGYPFAMDPPPTHSIPSGYADVHAFQEMELPSGDSPGVVAYLSAMRRFYPADVEKLSWASELSWLGAKMFVEALRRAGQNPTRAGILNALDTMTKFDSGLAPPYTIRPGPHDFIRCVKGAKLSADHTWIQESDWYCL